MKVDIYGEKTHALPFFFSFLKAVLLSTVAAVVVVVVVLESKSSLVTVVASISVDMLKSGALTGLQCEEEGALKTTGSSSL